MQPKPVSRYQVSKRRVRTSMMLLASPTFAASWLLRSGKICGAAQISRQRAMAQLVATPVSAIAIGMASINSRRNTMQLKLPLSWPSSVCCVQRGSGRGSLTALPSQSSASG